MKNQLLYNELNIQAKEEIFDKAKVRTKEVYKTQNENLENLLGKIATVLLDEEIEGKILKLPSNRKKLLKKRIFEIISNSCKSEYEKEKEILNLLYLYSYEESIYLKQYIVSKGTETKFKKVPKEEIEKLRKEKIKDKTAEQRIKDNKAMLEKTLKIKVSEFLNGEINVNEIKKEISKRYLQNANNSKRLLEHEVIKTQEKADQFFRDNIIKDGKLMYLSTLDKKTCNDCAQYDGKVYEREQAPTLPRHVNCRCCLTEIIEDWKPNERRDNEIVGRHIDFKSYEEWKKEKIG